MMCSCRVVRRKVTFHLPEASLVYLIEYNVLCCGFFFFFNHNLIFFFKQHLYFLKGKEIILMCEVPYW